MDRISPCYSRRPDNIAKYQFLRDTQEGSEVRFYSMLQQYLQEMMPIVYTPTVGKAVQQYSDLYTAPRGITVSPRNIDQIREDYLLHDARIVVAAQVLATALTDGSAARADLDGDDLVS
jgi:malate dehydrogenase (oxaloacetate-decarboxylating)